MKTPLLLTLLLVPALGFAQNVGINTTTPASTLAVNGSVSAGYSSQTGNYTLTGSDYFVVYNGTAAATFTLPTAQTGAGNFKGRVYQIRNNATQTLGIVPASGELISGGAVVGLTAGSVAELISTGATSSTTWEVVSSSKPVYSTDLLREALASTGCANCAAYDAAAVNTWVSVAAADYTALQSLSGTTLYGAPSLTGAFGSSLSGNVTWTQNVTNQGQIPGNAYPYALALRTGSSAPSTLAGFKLKLSTTGQTAGYADWPTAGTAVPNGPTPLQAATVYYYVLKRPSAALTAAAYMAVYGASSFQCALSTGQGGTSYAGIGDLASPNLAQGGYTPGFQVLATPTKQW